MNFDNSPAASEERQRCGVRVIIALGNLIFSARDHADVRMPAQVDQLDQAVRDLRSWDGAFELSIELDGLGINGQILRFDATEQSFAAAVRAAFRVRGLFGVSALLHPPLSDLRELVRFLVEGAQAGKPAQAGQAPKLSKVSAEKLPPRGTDARPLHALRLRYQADFTDETVPRLAAAYAHAVFFVDHTIQELRVGGESMPMSVASQVVQDLVDLQALFPSRFLQLARTKAEAEEYWGFHAGNVAVLAITFAARLGLSRARRHDLGMAALFHDVGMAAIPAALLERKGELDERAKGAVKASPLFAARAILRHREVHPAALERALAAYECHLELIPEPGEPLPDIGFSARILSLCESFDALTTARPFRPARTPKEALHIMTTEQVFRFDPELVDLLAFVVEPLL